MKSLFTKLGLNEKETETFLKLLELGAQPVSVIAKHVGVPRPTMYLILDSLKHAQLVEEFERAGIKYFKAIPAKEIAGVLKSREREIEQTLSILQESLPELEALENKLSITPRVKFFEGKQAIMKMYESMLREKTFCAVFNPQRVKRMMPEYHFKIPETIRSEKLKVKELLVAGSDAEEYQNLFQSKNHQIKILPKTVNFESDTIICPEKIYMISYGEKDQSAIEIWNKSLAETQKILFEQLWGNI
ncbi:MAG: helix-turn-helix domain-containing protein [Candidatus Peregrinibacteria bacterium]